MPDVPPRAHGEALTELLDSLDREGGARGVRPELIGQARRELEEARSLRRRCGEMAEAKRVAVAEVEAARAEAEAARSEVEATRAEVEAARAEIGATRARAEEAVKALAESEQRYRYMGETIPYGVWWCNPQGEAEYTSPSFLELLDMTLEEQKKFGWTKRLVPEDVEPMMAKWLHCCATGTPWDHEHRIIDRHGRLNTVWSRGLPVRNEKGEIIAWVGVNLDITERKQIELQLQEAMERLEEAMQVKDQFLANISHELRTPLTLILGPVRKLLSAENLTVQQRNDLGVVERNARTLLKNVNDLLDLSKLDAGRMTLDYVDADVARLARFVASHFESVAEEGDIRLVVETPERLVGQVDPAKLQRVLLNLLSNAFKFTPARSTVALELRAEGEMAVFTVQDAGPGIPPALRDAVFDRFRQVDSSSTRRFGGTGLGLAIVREFVDLHQGTVQVAEASGGGALFTVRIPLRAPAGSVVKVDVSPEDETLARAAVAELRPQVDARAPGEERAAAEAPLVLIVEDNPEMNAFLAETLGERYRVATARDGAEGLRKALELRPDLIVSDIMMPRMSGEELVRELRQRRELGSVPILLLTAKADEETRVALLRTGAQDCLLKPFVADELLARAGGLIRSKRDAEAALWESERRYRTLFESIDEGFCILEVIFDADGRPIDHRFLETNPSFEQQSGLHDVQGKTMRELEPQHEAHWFEAYGRVALTGQPVRFRNHAKQLGRWFDVYAFRFGAAEDRQVAVLFSDVTERKKAEDSLRESQQILQFIVDNSPDNIFLQDADLRYVWVGRAAAPLTREEYIGRTDFDLAPPEDAQKLMAIKRRVLSEERRVTVEIPLTLKGEPHVFEATYEPRRDEGGRTVALAGYVRDITARKRVEEGLQAAREQAEAANRAKDHFLAVLSHELRTPLTPVLAIAHALEMDTTLPAAAREDLATIRRNVQTEARLIDDLLDLTRIARGKIDLHPELVDVHKTLGAALELCRGDLRTKGLEVALDYRADVPHVWADSARLQQIFLNLLHNAIKFTPAGGRIRVGTLRRGERLHVEVSDNGVGIPPDRLPRIFDAFEQGERTVTRGLGGLGLGLAIVKSLVELHGGTVRAESAGVGRGATFEIELNLAPRGAVQAAAPSAPLPRSAVTHCRILLVEDHPDTLRIMSRLLKGFGHTVFTASAVAEALEVAEREELDVVLSDIGLPDGSGLDIMRALKERGIKGIALSGFGLEEDVQRSLDAGFSEHLTKPVNLHVLDDLVRRIGC